MYCISEILQSPRQQVLLIRPSTVVPPRGHSSNLDCVEWHREMQALDQLSILTGVPTIFVVTRKTATCFTCNRRSRHKCQNCCPIDSVHLSDLNTLMTHAVLNDAESIDPKIAFSKIDSAVNSILNHCFHNIVHALDHNDVTKIGVIGCPLLVL